MQATFQELDVTH
ncbi:hypothetical protein D020_1038A, partial [Vibrio parahaemolyticus SBR10290]